MFYGGGEREERYGLGLNWHTSRYSNFVLSLLISNIVYPRSTDGIPNNHFFDYVIFSLNAGSLSLSTPGMHFFFRGGVAGAIIHYPRSDNPHLHFEGINLDVGIGWNFN